jgi:flavorubredoxin
MAVISEIAPDVYRISVFAQAANLQFNHFLVKDDEPLLYHTGLRGFHAEIHQAVSTLINVSELRHISYSHFESDKCGSLNEWLAAAPNADVICSQVGAFVNVNDFIGREARALPDGGTFATGKYRYRYCQTPHLPHGWDAGLLFEETQKTLFFSDLFHHVGNVEPLTSADVVGRSHQSLKEYQAGVLAAYVPYTPLTAQNLKKLADLKPKTLAIMHGLVASTWRYANSSARRNRGGVGRDGTANRLEHGQSARNRCAPIPASAPRIRRGSKSATSVAAARANCRRRVASWGPTRPGPGKTSRNRWRVAYRGRLRTTR